MITSNAHTTNWMSSKIKHCWNTLHTSIFSFEKFTSDWLIFSCSISPEGMKCRHGAFRVMRIKERQTYYWGKICCSALLFRDLRLIHEVLWLQFIKRISHLHFCLHPHVVPNLYEKQMLRCSGHLCHFLVFFFGACWLALVTKCFYCSCSDLL